MGLESRDYFRDGRYTDSLGGWGVHFTPVAKYLILANVAVFLLQIFVTRSAPPEWPEDFTGAIEREQAAGEAEAESGKPRKHDPKAGKIDREKAEEYARKLRETMEQMMGNLPGMRVSVVQEWLQLDPHKTIEQGQLWRLVTSAFCHDRYMIWHILFNMLLLYWFGTTLETMYGGREFLLFYLAAAVCSSLAFVGLAYYTGSNIPAIGASGAVMGVMMLYTIYYPFQTVLIFWLVPVPIWVLLSVYVIYDLHPVLLALAGDQVFSTVAHAGHLGGLAFGFVYWKLGLRLETPWQRRRIPRRRIVFTTRAGAEPAILPHPQRDALNDRLDEVLQKISHEGQESLTEEEREILFRASAKLRGKG